MKCVNLRMRAHRMTNRCIVVRCPGLDKRRTLFVARAFFVLGIFWVPAGFVFMFNPLFRHTLHFLYATFCYEPKVSHRWLGQSRQMECMHANGKRKNKHL